MRPIKTSLPGWYRSCLRNESEAMILRNEVVVSRKDAKGAKTQRSTDCLRIHLCVFAPFASLRELSTPPRTQAVCSQAANSSRVPYGPPLLKPLSRDDMGPGHS